MDVDVGSLVLSVSGRDKGDLFVVLRCEEDFLYLANGKARKVEKPKKKKLRHISAIGMELENLKNKLKSGEMPTNAEIRKSLKEYAPDVKDESQGRV